MSMKQFLRRRIQRADELVAANWLALFGERLALLIFTFHALFRDADEIAQQVVKPQQEMTCEHFRRFIEYWQKHEYRFVAPKDLSAGLVPGKKYAMITFDDGYFNNFLALPILQKYNVPAVFYIAVNNIRQEKCFWWDVLYRERHRQGRSSAEISHELSQFTQGTNDQIEGRMHETFGRDCLRPVGDVDRPMTVDELVEFSKDEHVVIGNHTMDHAILTNYPQEEARRQVLDAQQFYDDLLGVRPDSIAYPAVAIARAYSGHVAREGFNTV